MKAALRLHVLSDLHVELAAFDSPFAAFSPIARPSSGRRSRPAGDAIPFDVVVLAGDIANGVAALYWAREMFPDHPIVQVAGNHEFYDGCYEASLNALRETAQRLQIHFLENDCVAIDGVEFIGCTLWTDYQVFELPGRPHAMSRLAAMQACRDRIADHRAIQLETGLGPAGSGRRFEPSDAARLHEASRAFLHERLARPDPARECVPPSRQLPDEASGAEACNASSQAKVVVTHHLPSWRCVDSRYAQSVTNAAFCSDLDDLIGKASLWIHGHTHVSLDRMLEGTRVVCNPRGYPRRAMPGGFENPDFDPVRVLELARSGA